MRTYVLTSANMLFIMSLEKAHQVTSQPHPKGSEHLLTQAMVTLCLYNRIFADACQEKKRFNGAKMQICHI